MKIYLIFTLVFFNCYSNNVDTLKTIQSFLKKEVNFFVKNELGYSKFNNSQIKTSEIDFCFEDFSIKRSDLKLANYSLYEVYVNKIITNKQNEKQTYNEINKIHFLLFDKILIAYSDDEILVLSGRIYNNMFSQLFKFNDLDFSTYISYLELKMSMYDYSKIVFEKRKKDFLFFSLIINNEKIYFKFKKSNPNFVIELGHKISGRYKKNKSN
ncbi:hypothetical protein [Flavobacterium difficile]|uniref:Lipoprotein n=1 Tax=Flavobacterium difficile TaxID=2709659 RepID=A0ABX0I0T0_9FLAO|nr:hypothetical protein [Flavobacterium difficile]NHM00801.1 hypothetical protein [Flavobacterium difficile]